MGVREKRLPAKTTARRLLLLARRHTRKRTRRRWKTATKKFGFGGNERERTGDGTGAATYRIFAEPSGGDCQHTPKKRKVVGSRASFNVTSHTRALIQSRLRTSSTHCLPAFLRCATPAKIDAECDVGRPPAVGEKPKAHALILAATYGEDDGHAARTRDEGNEGSRRSSENYHPKPSFCR